VEAAALTRALILPALLTLLAGCTAPQPPQADCPPTVPVPAPLVGKPSAAKVGALEIRVELARTAERARGDCWRDAFEGMKK
jgi:hypothetical protein